MDNLIESYKLIDIAKKEKLDTWTIKRRYNYIPVKVTTWQSKANCKFWNQKRDYSIRYIRLDDILKLLKDEIDFTFVRKKQKWK